MAKLLIVQREQFTSATSRASAKQNNNGVANTAIETLTVLSFTLERSRGTVSVFGRTTTHMRDYIGHSRVATTYMSSQRGC